MLIRFHGRLSLRGLDHGRPFITMNSSPWINQFDGGTSQEHPRPFPMCVETYHGNPKLNFFTQWLGNTPRAVAGFPPTYPQTILSYNIYIYVLYIYILFILQGKLLSGTLLEFPAGRTFDIWKEASNGNALSQIASSLLLAKLAHCYWRSLPDIY